MKLRDWTAYIKAGLNNPGLEIRYGPDQPEDLADMYVLLTTFPGAPLDTEMLFDNPAVQVECVGKPNNYNSAEDLAWLLDTFLLKMQGVSVGGLRVTHVQRLGGQPSVLLVDDADRHHFVCSYMPHVQSYVGA